MQRLVVLISVTLAALGAGVVTLLSARADQSRQAQLALTRLQAAFDDLQAAPNRAVVLQARSATRAAAQSFANQTTQAVARVRQAGRELDRFPRVSELSPLEQAIRSNITSHEAAVTLVSADPQVLVVALSGHLPPLARALIQHTGRTRDAVSSAMRSVNAAYSRRARHARLEEIAGATAVMALLLMAFVFYFRRSRRLHDDVTRLLAESRHEAMSDALTGLANRRALERDLAAGIERVTPDQQLYVVLYDLDGFKRYNDTFGHPAGDALLIRLGAALSATTRGVATAYRMGGDEFCLLAYLPRGEPGSLAELGAATLTEYGEGFSITASFGEARIPTEAADAKDALRLADQRLYRQKAQRGPAVELEVTRALMAALTEHTSGLDRHSTDVSNLACETALALGLGQGEIDQIGAAARLHDIGKLGIPESILDKPGPLDAEEWAFIRRHTVIGERIISAAESLASAARLVRSSHERFDGDGYPDGLRGSQIPIGARIIAVCDAYDAMVTARPYSPAKSPASAMAELKRCAGRQFDPDVVRAFAAALVARAEVSAVA
jgi:diguanylate cyclase (GGDEF)-like protein